MRIGVGYDIHRLVDDRKLFLGGVEIPYVRGLIGHSDGDVLVHAISDAILGALALGDIGQHFPNTDPQYKDISSMQILKRVKETMARQRFEIINIDTTVIAEEPKVYPFKQKMIEALSENLGISKDRINIKATTNEGVGAIGRGDAIAAYAVVMLQEKIG